MSIKEDYPNLFADERTPTLAELLQEVLSANGVTSKLGGALASAADELASLQPAKPKAAPHGTPPHEPEEHKKSR